MVNCGINMPVHDEAGRRLMSDAGSYIFASDLEDRVGKMRIGTGKLPVVLALGHLGPGRNPDWIEEIGRTIESDKQPFPGTGN